jgi:hypothetical protein
VARLRVALVREVGRSACHRVRPRRIRAFTEARDKKLEELNKQPQANAAVPTGSNPPSNEKPLRNDDVLSLVKVGLDDKLIISKIQAAEATDFDLSTEGIVALKTAKVSNAVIDAMMKRPGK